MHSTGKALDRILTPYMNTLETCTDLERRGELPPGEGVKPMNLASQILPRGSSSIAFADTSLSFHLLQIVITDGAPTDDPASVLVRIARRVSRQDKGSIVNHFADRIFTCSHSWTKAITHLASSGLSFYRLETKMGVSRTWDLPS